MQLDVETLEAKIGWVEQDKPANLLLWPKWLDATLIFYCLLMTLLDKTSRRKLHGTKTVVKVRHIALYGGGARYSWTHKKNMYKCSAYQAFWSFLLVELVQSCRLFVLATLFVDFRLSLLAWEVSFCLTMRECLKTLENSYPLHASEDLKSIQDEILAAHVLKLALHWNLQRLGTPVDCPLYLTYFLWFSEVRDFWSCTFNTNK